MRKSLSVIIVLTMILSLAACSGGQDNSSTNVEEPKQETSTTQTTTSPQEEEKKTKPNIWERSESDVLDRIEYIFGRQILYDGEFSLTHLASDENGTIYQVLRDGLETHCGIAFKSYSSGDTNKLNIKLIITDYSDSDSMEAYVLCGAIILFEDDVDDTYSSLRDAKDAFAEFASNAKSSPYQEMIGNTMYTFRISDDSSSAMITIGDPNDFTLSENSTSTQESTNDSEKSQASAQTSTDTQKNQATVTEGMYLVGSDIQAGTYKLTAESGKSGYYCRYSDASGESSSIISNDNFNSTSYVTVNDGEYLKLTRCTGVLQ